MDSHSFSFSGATHKERPGLSRTKSGHTGLQPGADLVYLSFWMGTNLETVTKFRAFGGSSRTNSGFLLLSPGRNLGTPAFGGHRRPEIQEIHQGLGNGFRKRSGLYKIDKFWAFVGFPSFRLSQKPETQEIHRGFGNGFRKRSGLYKIDNFWAFVGFPPFRRSQRPEIQKIHRGLGNGFRKRSGLYKIDKFWAFVGFPPKFCHKIKGLEHILGRSRGGPFSKMWPPLNGHMDSHSSSFSGATHKERPGLPRKG